MHLHSTDTYFLRCPDSKSYVLTENRRLRKLVESSAGRVLELRSQMGEVWLGVSENLLNAKEISAHSEQINAHTRLRAKSSSLNQITA